MRTASHTAPLMNRTACREERVQVTRDDMRTPLQLPLFLQVSIEMVSSCRFCNSLDRLLHFSQLFSRRLAFWLPCEMRSTVPLTWQRARQCPTLRCRQAQLLQITLYIRYEQLPHPYILL